MHTVLSAICQPLLVKEATKGNFECTYFKQLVKECAKSPNGTRCPGTRYFWFYQFCAVESDM